MIVREMPHFGLIAVWHRTSGQASPDYGRLSERDDYFRPMVSAAPAAFVASGNEKATIADTYRDSRRNLNGRS